MYIYKIITLRASRRGQQRIEGTRNRPKGTIVAPKSLFIVDSSGRTPSPPTPSFFMIGIDKHNLKCFLLIDNIFPFFLFSRIIACVSCALAYYSFLDPEDL